MNAFCSTDFAFGSTLHTDCFDEMPSIQLLSAGMTWRGSKTRVFFSFMAEHSKAISCYDGPLPRLVRPNFGLDHIQ